MKKVFFITAMVAGSLYVKAQKAHVEPGLKGGLNVATLSTANNNSNFDPRISFNVGGLAHIHLTKEFALQPELLFSGQGAVQTISGVDHKANLNYLQLPVLLQYMAGTGFRLETGPQFGALVSAASEVGNVKVDTKNAYKTMDVAWVFGAGYLTTSGFGIDARYNLGLANINDVSGDKIHNRVFSVGIFYQFKPLKHS
jgi:hypothetical protein